MSTKPLDRTLDLRARQVGSVAVVLLLCGVLLGVPSCGGGPGRPGTDAGLADSGVAQADSGFADAGGVDGGGDIPESERTCVQLPPVADFGAKGPFDVEIIKKTGPNANYTLFRPGQSLGANGLKHPIATWGNGILTTPGEYKVLLSLIASHGFVIIACNDTQAEQAGLTAGLEWLRAQNQSGPMAGKLDLTREVTLGYSWGGGAAIDTANRPNVKATVSLHGMPPRQPNAFTDMHSPLLLFTSTGDSFVTKEEYVTPTYESSQVQTFYATLVDPKVGHLYVVDVGAPACLASVALGKCGDAQLEQAPTVAWLRMLACDDLAARAYFYGPDCSLCMSPWSSEKKNWPQPDSAF